MDFSAPRKSRLNAPQLQPQLSRLPKRLSKQVTRIEDLCHTQVSHTWLYHLDACAGSVLTPNDYIANVQKRLGNRLWEGGGQCRCCGAEPGITTELRGFTASQSRPPDIFTTAAVPGRSATLDVCVASSIAAAARRDAAQAAFDRKLLHYRNEIGDLRQHGIHNRPLVRTTDRRPHPASSRNTAVR